MSEKERVWRVSESVSVRNAQSVACVCSACEWES